MVMTIEDYLRCTMEPRKLRHAEQTMEDMSHLVEKHDDIMMPQECRSIGSGFRQVGDDGGDRVVARAIAALVSATKGPHGGAGVLVLYNSGYLGVSRAM